jgi:hypothetical protein
MKFSTLARTNFIGDFPQFVFSSSSSSQQQHHQMVEDIGQHAGEKQAAPLAPAPAPAPSRRYLEIVRRGLADTSEISRQEMREELRALAQNIRDEDKRNGK